MQLACAEGHAGIKITKIEETWLHKHFCAQLPIRLERSTYSNITITKGQQLWYFEAITILEHHISQLWEHSQLWILSIFDETLIQQVMFG